ncbi:MAG TPA: ABC transporter ATP-binding protein [Trebonia sp.]|nr:ABC transporter ATP-binding protein [Trebonia sp.]
MTVTRLAVEALGVTRRFGARTVLDGLDLEIPAAQFTALLGRSGSGKSTLLRALAGLDPGVEGSVRVPRRRAVVFQNARLLPWKRVLANVVYGLPGPDASQRGATALAEVGLTDRARAWPGTLSGGEAQRAALARALVREPELLLLDEPFGALDALTRIKMHRLLRELCRRHHPAVLLVPHDVDEAITLADRIVVLADGRLSLDIPVSLPGGRHRDHPETAALRAWLLAELGAAEAGPAAQVPAEEALAQEGRR